jgi:hypothetical protein
MKEKIDNYPSITKDEIDLMIKRLENYKNKNTSG